MNLILAYMRSGESDEHASPRVGRSDDDDQMGRPDVAVTEVGKEEEREIHNRMSDDH